MTGATAIVEDLGSRNGTSVRGVRISQPLVLADGDEIAVGGFTLKFRSAAGGSHDRRRGLSAAAGRCVRAATTARATSSGRPP